MVVVLTLKCHRRPDHIIYTKSPQPFRPSGLVRTFRGRVRLWLAAYFLGRWHVDTYPGQLSAKHENSVPSNVYCNIFPVKYYADQKCLCVCMCDVCVCVCLSKTKFVRKKKKTIMKRTYIVCIGKKLPGRCIVYILLFW